MIFMEAEPQISVLLDFLKEIKPKTVLEVGCNFGKELNAISNVERYGIDKNPSGLNKVDGITLCALGEDIPFKDNYIDVVYSMGCLSHNEFPELILDEMLRVSKHYTILIEWVGTKTGKDYTNCKQNTWIHDYEKLTSLKGELCFNRKMVFGADLFHILVLRKFKTIKNVICKEKFNPLFSLRIGKFVLEGKKDVV